MVITVA